MAFKTEEGERIYKKEYEKNLKLWPVPYETFYIPTSYGKTHIIAAGEKNLPPLIMLHGAGVSSAGWFKNIKLLSKHYRIYALDVIGDMNLSDPTKSIQNGNDSGKWVCEILDEMGIDKTSVVAHSAGGYAALHFVIFAQERVNRLVLLAPAASFVPFHKQKQFFVRLLLINLIRKEKFVNRFFGNGLLPKKTDIYCQSLIQNSFL